MDLFEQISNDIKEAMKAKDKVRLETLRNVKKCFLEAKTAPGANDTLTDEAALKIMQKLVKQGKDSAAVYEGQGRDDFYPGSYKNNRKKGNYKIYIFTQEDLDNDDIISMVETTPTYKRSKAVLESIQSRAVAEESSTPKLDNSENGSMTITF